MLTDLSIESYYQIKALKEYKKSNYSHINELQEKSASILLNRIAFVIYNCLEAKSLEEIKVCIKSHDNAKSCKLKSGKSTKYDKGFLRSPLDDCKAFNISKNHRIVAKEVDNTFVFIIKSIEHYVDKIDINTNSLKQEALQSLNSNNKGYIQNKSIVLKELLTNVDLDSPSLIDSESLLFPLNLSTHIYRIDSILKSSLKSNTIQHNSVLSIIKNMVDDRENVVEPYKKEENNDQNDVIHAIENKLIYSLCKLKVIAQDDLQYAFKEKMKDLSNLIVDIYDFNQKTINIIQPNDLDEYKHFFYNKLKEVFEKCKNHQKECFDSDDLVSKFNYRANESAFDIISDYLKNNSRLFEHSKEIELSNGIKISLFDDKIFKDGDSKVYKLVTSTNADISLLMKNHSFHFKSMEFLKFLSHYTRDLIEDRIKYYILKNSSAYFIKKQQKTKSYEKNSKLNVDVDLNGDNTLFSDVDIDISNKIEFDEYIQKFKNKLNEDVNFKNYAPKIEISQSNNTYHETFLTTAVTYEPNAQQSINNIADKLNDLDHNNDGLEPPKPNRSR